MSVIVHIHTDTQNSVIIYIDIYRCSDSPDGQYCKNDEVLHFVMIKRIHEKYKISVVFILKMFNEKVVLIYDNDDSN